jgi:hypothetical protein
MHKVILVLRSRIMKRQGKLEGKRPLGRSRRGWEDNIEWIFKKWGDGHELD